jgi:DNA polymerase-3 subunit alpha
MDNIPQFVDSKNGRQKINYPDPSLEEVLKETYGVIVYQEQVMEVARIIAGYSMGQADLLRRAMGKKKKEILDKEKKSFLEGAAKQGYSSSKAGAIYDMLIPFAGYGFNKSHAAAYSVIAYHTAYLKANFPAEFMAANLTNEIHSANKDKLSECIDEARRMGIAIDPPDVNRSDKLFTVVDGRIVYGFLGIKGLGDSPAGQIVKGRKDGPYKSIIDFLDRVDIKAVGKKVIELLVQTGAFDSFGVSRETLAGNLERAVEYAQKKKEDKELGQSSLFEDTEESGFPDFEYEEAPAAGRAERLNLEKQLIGFYFSGHPMDEYREIWQKAVKADLGRPDSLKIGNCILVGIIKSVKTITTGKGNKMTFATLADYNGEIEMTFFARAWEKCQSRVEAGKVAMLRGKIEYQQDRDRRGFIVDDWVSAQEVDAVIKETEEQERKWDALRNTWVYMADLKSGSLARAEKGSYTIVGFLKSFREIKDRNGGDMAFGVLRDFEGDIDLVFFSRVWNECRDLLKLDEIVAFKGSIDPANDRNPEKPGFKVSSIADIAQLSRGAVRKASAGEEPPKTAAKSATEKINAAERTNAAGNIHIRLNAGAAEQDENLYPLRDFLAQNSGPCPVFIHVGLNNGEKIIRTVTGLASIMEGESLGALKNCAGVAEVWRE